MAFVHLQTHSEYSILRASCRAKALLNKAIEMGQSAVALTDHGNMFGMLEFYMEAKSLNKSRKAEGLEPINPIIGCHIFVDHPAADRKEEITYQRLTLLAETDKGYSNLLRIVSHCYIDEINWKEIPGVPLEILASHSEGLIALAGDFFSRFGSDVVSGKEKLAKEYLDSLRKIFDSEHLFLTLSNQGVPEQRLLNVFLADYAKEFGLSLVATNNVHYLNEEDHKAHKVLRCIGLAKKLNEFEDKIYPTSQFYFRSEQEMRELFAQYPEAIDNTEKIAKRCHVTIRTNCGDEFWPKFQITEEFKNSEEYAKIKQDMQSEYEKELASILAKETEKYCEEKSLSQETLSESDKQEIEKSAKGKCCAGTDSDIYLISLCNNRLKSRYPEENCCFPVGDSDVASRLRTELNCIRNMKVAGYLLIVWDFINWSRENGIPVGPGRGSAAGSIVTYIIGITDIDPLRFGLLFERFLNPERVSMPDIDTDISDRDRGRVIQYVTEHYGAQCVSQIVTYGSLKMRQVINDVGRVLNIPLSDVRSIIDLLPKDNGATLSDAKTGVKKGQPLPDYSPDTLNEKIQSREIYKDLWEYSEKLENLARQTGVHAAAVVIAPVEMYKLAPVYRAVPSDTPVVMYDKHYAEDIGLLKMDFLGLITLSMIQDTLALIKKNHGFDLDIGHIPLDDKKTYELFSKGLTVGVFQFESAGMQKYLRELNPTCIEDLIAMNALYRPGPLEQVPRFIRCKNGVEEINCYHPDLEPILKETYGVIVYQEQVMRLAQILGGYTLGGADIIRRIMAKKKPAEMEKLQPEFFEKCISRGYDPKMIEEIWAVLLPFCGYAFNKSHAAAYSYVAYQTAYLKTHYGAEYMAATMSAEISKVERIVVMLKECDKLGIKYLPPCVNRSEARFSVDKNSNILYGLAGIKNVGFEVVEDLVAEREKNGPYTSIFDLCKRVLDYQASCPTKRPPLNKRILESLVLAGALDNLHNSQRERIFASIDKALNLATTYQNDKEKGQISLFDSLEDDNFSKESETLEQATLWPFMEKLNKEKGIVGCFLSSHPLEEFRPELIGFASCTLAQDELRRHDGDSNCIVGGIVTSSRSVDIQKGRNVGKTIGFLEIQDFHGTLSLSFGPEKWEKYRSSFGVNDRVLAWGSLKYIEEKQEMRFSVDSIESLENIQHRVKEIHIECMSSSLKEENLDKLKTKMEALEAFPGEPGARLIFHVETLNSKHTLLLSEKEILYSSDFLYWLKKEFMASNVWVSGKK